MILSHIPYRVRIPIHIALWVTFSGIILTASLGWQRYADLKNELQQGGQILAIAYAQSLIKPLKHADIWRAYGLISIVANKQNPSFLQPDLILVRDDNGKTFVSNYPRNFPVGLIADISKLHHYPIKISVKINENGGYLGEISVFYSENTFWAVFYQLLLQILFTLSLLLLIILPMGWFAGKKLSDPLVELTDCLSKLEQSGPESALCNLHEGSGELGKVGKQLRKVLKQLSEKAVLEQQMIAEERLAAIGRLAAGVAHEVNNPLGGMITAIDTFKHHGDKPQVAKETILLVERGLEQIRQTVSALLVQSRVKDRLFNSQDVDDIYSLLKREIIKKQIQILWENKLTSTLPLPAADLRQILINLLLNAIQAVQEKGHINFSIEQNASFLTMTMANSGEKISEAKQKTIFEPFVSHSGKGSGLGLWVCLQLIQQLEGKITLSSDDKWTKFQIIFPLGEINE